MKFLLTVMTLTGIAFANAQSGWSGEAIFDVNPVEASESQWDYIPHTITYQTDGEHWRVLEQGTSFERIWIGNHGASDYHILFHFLGHAIELEEPCPPGRTAALEWGAVPCPWSDASSEEIRVKDGPVQYALLQRSVRSIPHAGWSRNHFDLPSGYEPIDKPGLAALLQSLGQTRD